MSRGGLPNKQIEVVVLCVNGRRVTIKTCVTSSIGQVIEEACAKQKLDPYAYNLKHLKRILDPSNSLQYSNIPNHALLELIEAPIRRVEGNVTVNLVMDTGQRLIADFPSCTNLMEILQHHERGSENNFAITSTSSGEEPFIVYTMRKIVGEELRTVTLKSLGLYGGRCMLRYGVQKISSESVSSQIVITKSRCSGQLKQLDAGKSALDKNDTASGTEKRTMHIKGEKINPTSANHSSISDGTKNSLPELRSQDEVADSVVAMVTKDEVADTTVAMVTSNEKRLDSLAETRKGIGSNKEEKNECRDNSVIDIEQMDCDSTTRESCVITEDSNVLSQGNKSLDIEKPGKSTDNTQHSFTPSKSTSKIIPLADHNSVLFNLDDAPPTISESENDDFFELSANEVRKMYSERVREVKEMDEAPLMTQQMRQLEQDSRLLSAMNRHPVTQLRICFPDRHVIQANFKPRNTIREVMDFLRPLLIRSDIEFSFYTPFPRMELDPSLSLVDAECIPKARLYFSAEGGPTFLNEETLNKKSSFEGASNAVVVSRNNTSPNSGKQLQNNDFLQPAPSGSRDNATIEDCSSRAKPKIISPTQHKPKWFKLGK